MSWIDEDPKDVAEKIAPYGDIDHGLRKSKPKDENGLVQYVWRMCRFYSGEDVHMPVTSYFWLQDWIDEMGIDANVCGVHDDTGEEILDELDDLISRVLRDEFEMSDVEASKRWERAGLF